jgi:hypothetical protein
MEAHVFVNNFIIMTIMLLTFVQTVHILVSHVSFPATLAVYLATQLILGIMTEIIPALVILVIMIMEVAPVSDAI